jgi:hypothetical protein
VLVIRLLGLRRVRDEEGATLIVVALWLPTLILFVILVVDVGNWFVHKRHLQLQADAGALAGGGVFKFPCSDDPILTETRRYAGDPSSSGPYNLQVAPTDQSNIHVLVNSAAYWNEGGTNFSDGGTPCNTRFIDVKMTEANLPWFFGLNVVPAINAHARVAIQSLVRSRGALPVAVPDIDPTVGRVYFVDESTGATLASAPLTKAGFDSGTGLAVWDNAAAPVSVPIGPASDPGRCSPSQLAGTSCIGVRIALGGGTSTTCGERLVQCYDLSSSNGILYVNGWPTGASSTPPNPPTARSVKLFSGSCPDAYFNSGPSCSVGVSAKVDFGTVDFANPNNAKVSAVMSGVEKQLQYDSASQAWISTSAGNSFFTVSPGAGGLPVEIKWEVNQTGVTIAGNACTTTGGNKCKGTFGVRQRTFTAAPDLSGPIKDAKISQGGVYGANSFAFGSSPSLVVRIGITGNLQEAQTVNDPAVLLRVTGGSQNQSIDCDPGLPNLRDEISQGCAPEYAINEGQPCPATAQDLWQPQPPPWYCVAIQTGGAIGQLEQGMRNRILGGAATCVSPNNWSSFPNLPDGDPRIVPVFVTPFGTFGGSGNEVVPVTKFATFYVTGWFSSPCSTDDPVPDKGYVVGHFINYIYALNNGGGSGELCDLPAFGSCVAVLTD